MYLQVFGKNLKREMTAHGYVPHTLAPELGLGVRSIWNYLKGTQIPTLPTVADISNLLSVSPNDLLRSCYTDHYTGKIIDLMEKLKRSDHRRMLNIIIEYFLLNHNSLANTDLGHRIRTVRKERGMSVKELADAVGVASTSIVNYETNHQFPKFSNFVFLCETLEVSAEFLFFDLLRTEHELIYRNLMNLTPDQVTLLLKILANT